MENTTFIVKCASCFSKNKCVYKEYKGKKNSVTGMYIAHIDNKDKDKDKEDCILYGGFAR